VKRLRSLTAVLLALAGTVLLAACGDKDKTLPPSVVITVQAEPVATLLPGCGTGEMVSWYEVASTLIGTFKDESLRAIDSSPQDIATLINYRLIPLRDKVGETPAPECAAVAHNTIMEYMRQILDSFQRYANGATNQKTMKSEVQAAAKEIDNTITPLLTGTQASLEQRLREERATQEAGGTTGQ
jgi:hypothetical protein